MYNVAGILHGNLPDDVLSFCKNFEDDDLDLDLDEIAYSNSSFL